MNTVTMSNIDASPPAYPSVARAWTLVVVLMMANIFSFIDRQILNLLIDPIRADLKISDIEMSLLIGPSFAVFYCLFAFPFGRMVDTLNRIRLAGFGIALWSAMTIAAGFSTSFLELMAARVGVAIGEAVLFPCANSLIADSFPRAARARPVGAFQVAVYLGSGLAFLFGASIVWLVESGNLVNHLPHALQSFAAWQLVLLAVGTPGLLVAMATLMMTEPARHERAATEALPISAVFRSLQFHKALYSVQFVGFAMVILVGYSVMTWAPTYLVRGFGMDRASAGLWFGLTVMVSGLLGTLSASSIADRLMREGRDDAKFIVVAIACALGVGSAVAAAFVTSPVGFILLMGMLTVSASAGVGLGPSVIGDFVPNELRGQILAIYLLVATVLGAGLGPVVVAFLSQEMAVDLKVAISWVSAIALGLGCLLFVSGRKALREAVGERKRAVDPTAANNL